MQSELVDIIIATAKELGDDELAGASDLDEATKLFGKGGALDSMGLVTLIIAVEQAIEDGFDKSIALADEKALSQANSPYRTVTTLADYAAEQIREN